MGYYKRLNKAFTATKQIPFDENSKFILMSDCHRGNATWNDNFLKNQNLFFAALRHYGEQGYTYIELGDGDEMWENRSICQIVEVHSDAFWIMSQFWKENRFFSIFGNHDMCKKGKNYCTENLDEYYCESAKSMLPLFPGIDIPEAFILKDIASGQDIYLTHGHQADALNSTFWKLSRFLVRYIWKPLEHMGFLDPTSAAKNNSRKRSTEQKLSHWCEREEHILITGHTHRPMLPDIGGIPYCNTGSCVHPRCITGIELVNRSLTLVKWTYHTREDLSVVVGREELAGPISIDSYIRVSSS